MANEDNHHQRSRASSLDSPGTDQGRPTSSGSASASYRRPMRGWRVSRPSSRPSTADSSSVPHTPRSGRMPFGGFLLRYSPFSRHTDTSGSPSSPAPARGGMSLLQELEEADESEDATSPSEATSPWRDRGSDSRHDFSRLRHPSAVSTSSDQSRTIRAQDAESVNFDSDSPATGRSRRALPPLQRTTSDVNAAMTRAMTSRATMLRPLLDRLREARLFTDMGSLMDVTLRIQNSFRPLDMEIVEQFAEGFIEDFRHRLDHPGAGSALPVEMRDQVTDEMNAFSIRMRNLMTEVAASTLQTDADIIWGICVDLNRCIGVNTSRPASAGRARARSDPRTPTFTRRTSQISILSKPESISDQLGRSLNRERLYAMPHAELVDFTMARDLGQNDLLDEMRGTLETYEESIAKVQEEKDTAHEKMLHMRAEFDLEKAKVHEFGILGMDIDGNKVTTPQQQEQEPDDRDPVPLELRIRSRSPRRQKRGSGGFQPFPDRPTSPKVRSPPAMKDMGSLAAFWDEDEDQKEQDFAELQRIIALLNDEDDLVVGFIDRTAQRAALSTRTVSESDATQSSPEVSLHRASTSSTVAAASGDLTKEQLQTRLRIVEEDRDALQRERDTFLEQASHGHGIDDLVPRDRERIAFFAERALRFIDKYLNDFIRCGQNLSTFAGFAVEVGRMDMGQQTCMDELQVLLETSRMISDSRPKPYERDPEGFGQFAELEASQNEWLPDVEQFLNRFVKLFDDVRNLTYKARAWDIANPRDVPDGQPKDHLVYDSVPNDRKSGLLSRAASGISDLLYGATETDQPHGPAAGNPEWSGIHQHSGVGEQQSGSARSRTSGSSRVSFADAHSQLPVRTTLRVPPKGILRRSAGRPRSLDIGRANSSRQGTRAASTGTPYPFLTPEGRAAGSSSLSSPATSTSAPHKQSSPSGVPTAEARSSMDSNIARHETGESSVVQRSDHLGRPSSMFQPPGDLNSGGLLGLISRTGSSRASRGSGSSPTTIVSEQGPRRSSQPTPSADLPPVSAAAASLDRGSHSASQDSSSSQPSHLPPDRLSRGPSFDDAPEYHTDRKSEGRSQDLRGSSTGQNSAEAGRPQEGSTHGGSSPIQRLDFKGDAQDGRRASQPQLVGDHKLEDGRAEGDGADAQPARPQESQAQTAEPRAGQRPLRGDQPRRQSGSRPPSESDGSSGGRRQSEWSDHQWPQALSPVRAPLPSPEWQLLRLVGYLSRWLTYGQLFNIWFIICFLVALVRSYARTALDLLITGTAGPRRVRVLPAEEMLSLALWCIIVGHLAMMAAMGEERRLWLAANPTTAGYLRGLRHRSAYPWWLPYEVDFALLVPVVESWTIWLHQLYFRRGREHMRALPDALELLVEAMKNLIIEALVAVGL